MAEHRTIVSADGLKTGTGLAEAVYRWAAFEGVTVEEGVIVLWLEPGAGVLVPRTAFAEPAAETAFLEAVRGHMTEAKRAGST